jgi:hypothetical protein
MLSSRRWLYRAEIAASLFSACLFVLTLFDPTWIERWFDESPDGGDGSLERWFVGGGFLVAALLAAALARRERRAQLLMREG